ncbi:hypothetical protein [Methylobacterium dankookense]|uniref:Secreted protein n=1 Tax=Methylobacterium dankookense TaxID=560405 RepID=A0A564FYX8_9HYPH|nr:hypothetical protein [Methylobacterium dankookense]GJD58511.1 hypothetical protein IFDJLNFL_4432 [Methylobacterium dankookense]VUF13192.1 hypothetical protein MTDSW087_02891 [Methylobacterium dankookense]
MRTVSILAGLGLILGGAPALAQDAAGPGSRGNQEFLGVDLDSGGVYYNGRNSGHYCLYRTVEVFNRYTGYVELRRVRRCGRGLYLP